MNPLSVVAERLRRWKTRRHSYRACFLDETGKQPTRAGDVVLKDLAVYCNAYRSTVMASQTGMVDPIASAVAQGRREVWLRIQAQLQLPDEALLQVMESES